MRSRRRATSFFISARDAWICASSSRHRSWPTSGMRPPPWTKYTASVTSTHRDLIGFVDGTENPQGALASDSTIIGDEDAAFAGGSYVIVQKVSSRSRACWNALSTEAQELIIGRKKLSDIELDDSVKPTCAHSALTVIEENGKEVKILRDNMPFGRPLAG